MLRHLPMGISSVGVVVIPPHATITVAKSAINRHHAKRIYSNWVRNVKLSQSQYKLESLSFGKVFKQDPWDCGVPQCTMCTGWRVEDKAKRRASLRKAERQALNELS